MKFTTSDGILKRGRPSFLQPSGPIYQTIDAEKLCARNEERIEPLPGLWWLNQVVAKLSVRAVPFIILLLLASSRLDVGNVYFNSFILLSVRQPTSPSFAKVAFRKFKLGSLEIQAPDSARGALDTTFLDEEMRISRGDKGNLFILTMSDKTARLVDPDDPDRKDLFAENTLSLAMNIALISFLGIVLLFIVISRLPTKA